MVIKAAGKVTGAVSIAVPIAPTTIPTFLSVLKNFEPRIVLRDIRATSIPDDNQINVEIEYDIVGLGFPPQNIEFLLLPT